MSESNKARNFATGVNIPPEKREKVISLLNQQLADTIDLYNNTKQAHWNVKSGTFFMLHELFDKLADDIENFVDVIAERVTALGGYAEGTTRAVAARSRIRDYPFAATSGEEHLRALIEGYTLYANETRKAIDTSSDLGDLDTADVFTEVSRAVDKSLWFLEAHLQK